MVAEATAWLPINLQESSTFFKYNISFFVSNASGLIKRSPSIFLRSSTNTLVRSWICERSTSASPVSRAKTKRASRPRPLVIVRPSRVLNDEFLNAVLRSYIQHELLHHIIEAPFNSYGEQFTILISAKLNLDSCSNEWKCYYKIIKKSKFIQAEWKLKSDLYNQNILSENQSFLLSKLKYLTDKVLAGENVKPKRLKSKKLSIYPENEPLC